MTTRFDSSAGFSLVELTVVVVLIAILTGLALKRVIPLIGRAEAVAFLTVKNQLNSALMMETAKRIASGRSHLVPDLEDSNPMRLLFEPPENYLGEMSLPRHETLPTRSWYFDRVSDQLFYRVGDVQRFGLEEPTIGFQVKLAWPEGRNASETVSASDVAGVKLIASHEFVLTY